MHENFYNFFSCKLPFNLINVILPGSCCKGLKIDHAKQIRKWPKRLAWSKSAGSFLTILGQKNEVHVQKMLMHSKWIFIYVAAISLWSILGNYVPNWDMNFGSSA